MAARLFWLVRRHVTHQRRKNFYLALAGIKRESNLDGAAADKLKF